MFFKLGNAKNNYQYKWYSTIDAGASPLVVNDGTIALRGTLYDPIAWGLRGSNELSLKYTCNGKMIENIVLYELYNKADCERSYAPLFILIKLEAGTTYKLATWAVKDIEVDNSSMLWLYDNMQAYYKHNKPSDVLASTYPTTLTEDPDITEYAAIHGRRFYNGSTLLYYNGYSDNQPKVKAFIPKEEYPEFDVETFCYAMEFTPTVTDTYLLVLGCSNNERLDNSTATNPGEHTRKRPRGVLCTPAPLPITGPDINAHHNKIKTGF